MRVIVPAFDPAAGVFTRATTGTYIDESNALNTSSVDQPRYQDGQLLVEAATSNLLQYSEDLRNTAEAGATRPWTQFDDTGGGVQVKSETTSKPTGASGSVSKLTANTTGALQRQASQVVSGIADGEVVTFSVFIKAVEVPRVALKVGTKANTYPGATFDLSTGGISSSVAGVLSAGSAAVAGGWWRCWVVANVSTGGTTPSVIAQLKNGSDSDYSGTIGDGVYIWGAQLEVGSAPTSYIPRLTAAAASRSADSFSGEYLVSFSSPVIGLPVATLDEDSTNAWVSGTTYALGDLVHRASTHRVYRRAVAGAGTTAPEADSANWTDVRATRRWAPLALTEDTRCDVIGNLFFTLVTDQAGVGLMLAGIRAETVRVVALAPPFTATAFDQTYTMPAQPSVYSAGSAGNEPVLAVLLPDSLPSGSMVHITLIGVGVGAIKTAWLRYLAFGPSYTLGGTLQGSRVGITDYSRKETDEFGATTLVPRAYAKRLTLEMTVPNSAVQSTFSLLADLRATPAMWVPADGADLSWLATYGWVKDWGITVAYSRTSLCSLEIEGLI